MSDKLRGQGGHMTAALLHKVAWLDHCIAVATRNGEIRVAKAMEHSRSKLVLQVRELLKDRGYYGPVGRYDRKPGPKGQPQGNRRHNGNGNHNGNHNHRGGGRGKSSKQYPAAKPVALPA